MVRRLFVSEEVPTRAELRWGEQTGRWRMIDRGVWAEDSEEAAELDRARAAVMA